MRGFGVLGTMREVPMRDERLEVSVTYDERLGYIATAPERLLYPR